ncbi:MAG: hypothetical protein K2K84_00695, partial [Muribaculaceae bacterium]|nr:hypothetical protein [Muribaculaceae bacterium]
FGNDALAENSPAFAWITEPDWFGMITPGGYTVLTTDGDVLESTGDSAANHAKAFIQEVYKDFNKR